MLTLPLAVAGVLLLTGADQAVERQHVMTITAWSPAELNRIAYVDGRGDLWVAGADGRNAGRLLKGDFTLPAWSEDGKAIAVGHEGRRPPLGHQHRAAAAGSAIRAMIGLVTDKS